MNIAHAQSARRTRTDGGTDGRTDRWTREPLTSSMEGLAHARPNYYLYSVDKRVDDINEMLHQIKDSGTDGLT